MKNSKDLSLDDDGLYFLPLGGSEEFGVNFNLYCHKGKWLAIDCGIGFADWRHPGVDILLPDPAFLEERCDDLVALIITHAHEDHVGAVPYLWKRLRCPIYCPEFTAAVLRKKFEEAPECRDAEVHVIRPGDTVDMGPFKNSFIHVTHSIPHTVSVVVETAAGRIVHSGDWNLDPTPVIGAPSDEAAYKAAGKKGVLAYVGDSTNSQVDGRSGSEAEVEKGLADLFKECENRIAVTIFSSNIGRVQSICRAAEAAGRSVAVIGRSLHSMISAAKQCGMLKGVQEFVSEEDIQDLPRERLVLIMTGSQGEARAALPKIARGEFQSVKLDPGDTVVFSSRAIPGNEAHINVVKNNLVAGGVQVITPSDTKHKIHVSGHPCRDEVADMYQWVKPEIVIPVHGEKTQLEAQAELARACQIKNVIVPRNGSLIRLAPGKAEIIDHVETGLLAMEPVRVMRADHPAFAERRKLQYAGAVHVTLVVDKKGKLTDESSISTMGLIDTENEEELVLEDDIMAEIEDIMADMALEDVADDHILHEEVRIGVRRYLNTLLKMKPRTSVHIVRG